MTYKANYILDEMRKFNEYNSNDYNPHPIWDINIDIFIYHKTNLINIISILTNDIIANFPYYLRTNINIKAIILKILKFRDKLAYIIQRSKGQCRRCGKHNHCKCMATIKPYSLRVYYTNYNKNKIKKNHHQIKKIFNNYNIHAISSSSRKTIIDSRFYKIDQLIGLLYITNSNTIHDVNLCKKIVTYRKQCTNENFNTCQNIIYLMYQPFSKQKYTGLTTAGCVNRHRQHMQAVTKGNAYFYKMYRNKFHLLICIELIHLDRDITTSNMRHIESLCIQDFKSKLNTQNNNRACHNYCRYYHKFLLNMKCNNKNKSPKMYNIKYTHIHNSFEYNIIKKSINGAAQKEFCGKMKIIIKLTKNTSTISKSFKRKLKTYNKSYISKLYNLAKQCLNSFEFWIFYRNLVKLKLLSNKLKQITIETPFECKSGAVELIKLINNDCRRLNMCPVNNINKMDVTIALRYNRPDSIITFFTRKSNPKECNCKHLLNKYPFLKPRFILGHIIVELNFLKKYLPLFDTNYNKDFNNKSRMYHPNKVSYIQIKNNIINFILNYYKGTNRYVLNTQLIENYINTATKNFNKDNLNLVDIYNSQVLNKDIKYIAARLWCDLVDKSKEHDISFTCIKIINALKNEYIKASNLKLIISLESADFEKFGDKHNFFNLTDKDTNLKRRKKHKNGKLRVLVKFKFFANLNEKIILNYSDIKYRPMVSYSLHVFQEHYSYGCKCINLLLCRNFGMFILSKIDNFIQFSNEFNERKKERKNEREWKIQVGDIQNFYPNSDMELAKKTISEMIEKELKLGYKYAAIPKPFMNVNQKPKTHANKKKGGKRYNFYKVGNNAYKDAENNKDKVILLNKKSKYNTHIVIPLEFLMKIATHAADNSYIRIGNYIYKQTQGAPIGSNLGGGLAGSYAVRKEALAKWREFTKFKLKRFVDDRFTLYNKKNINKDDLKKLKNKDLYGGKCKLDIEKEQKQVEFIGCDVRVIDGGILAVSPKLQFNFIHGHSCTKEVEVQVIGHLHRMRNFSNDVGWRMYGEVTLNAMFSKTKELLYDYKKVRRAAVRFCKSRDWREEENECEESLIMRALDKAYCK